MQTTNEASKQVRKAGILLTAVLFRAACLAQQAHGANPEASEPATRQIVVSIPDRKLALIENGTVKMIFPVAVGKYRTPSPSGSFEIVNRVVHPAYYSHGKVITSGPASPIGTRWIGLSEPGYGIHGTNLPASVGKAASHGCLRMTRADLEQLFALVQVGDQVEILAERDEQTARLFGAAPNTLLADSSHEAQSTGQ